MKISILCSDAEHPVNAYVEEWVARHAEAHSIELARKKCDLTGGDILFLISCAELVTMKDRAAYAASLVLHASDLPRGRGWSPHIWEIAAGAESIVLSLVEADDRVDSGRIWRKLQIPIPRHALWDEINHLLFTAEVQLMDFALASFGAVAPAEQSTEVEPTYFRRRTPEDSRIDPNKSIAEQFNLIRVCDPNRYPAVFEHLGQRYALKVEKLNDE